MQHSEAAALFNKDEKRVDWHDETLWFVREKRDKAAFPSTIYRKNSHYWTGTGIKNTRKRSLI